MHKFEKVQNRPTLLTRCLSPGVGGDVPVPEQPEEPGAPQEPLEVRLPPQDIQVENTRRAQYDDDLYFI